MTITYQSLNKKILLIGLLIYSVLFFTIDYLNMPYTVMLESYGLSLVVTNILLNLVMASLGSLLVAINELLIKRTGITTQGDNISLLAVVFGLLTYGCTPCVIAIFASVGISFSVMVLPLAGLPYKIISLVLMIVAIIWTYQESKRKGCPIKLRRSES